MPPRRLDQRDHVFEDQRIDADGIEDEALRLDQFVDIDDLLDARERMAGHLALQDGDFLHVRRIAERDAQQEAVELRLRQRERALVLDRVLRREHDEGHRQIVRHAVDRDLPLLHRFEQRGLRLRRRAVDLVREHDLRDDRAGPELEVARPLVEDRDAGDVAGQEVRRELDALERAADRAGHRLGQHGLADARHVLDQHMAPAEQRDERQLHLAVLADDHLLDIGDDAVRNRLNGRYRFG